MTYLEGIEISSKFPEKHKEHLNQRRTWALGRLETISEHPKEHVKALLNPSRYSAHLGLDIAATAFSPLLIEKGAEIANSGSIKTAAIAYGSMAGVSGIAYANATFRGETLESDTRKGKAREFAGDLAGLAAMPIYKTAIISYSVPGAFKDKLIDESKEELKNAYNEAVQQEDIQIQAGESSGPRSVPAAD